MHAYFLCTVQTKLRQLISTAVYEKITSINRCIRSVYDVFFLTVVFIIINWKPHLHNWCFT